ncbi:MAG: polysaccharide deacetylase family protein [Thermodesulfobacteriota bacterium]
MGLSLSGIYKEILNQLRLLLGMRNRNQLIILMYHGVVQAPLKVYDWCFIDEPSFRNQVKYLKRHFEVISLSEAAERLRNGKIYQPTAVITFDDGFQNNYDIAFPILREAGLHATIFLVTGLVDTSDTVWFCRLNRALAETNKTSLEWDSYSFDLSGPGPKAKTASAIEDRLKKFSNPRLLTELRKIILELGDDPDLSIEVRSPFRMLSHEAIKEMAASGLIEFGAHTHSHAILSLLSPNERQDEIALSVAAIHDLAGLPCELFAYPNGRAEDYNAEIIATLEACGIRASVTAIECPNNEMTPLMELRRYGIGANLSMGKFKRKVWRGIWQR